MLHSYPSVLVRLVVQRSPKKEDGRIVTDMFGTVYVYRALLEQAMKAKGAHPLYMPVHQNELGHSVNQRESYHELFSRKDRLGNPDFAYPDIMVLECGENVLFTPESR